MLVKELIERLSLLNPDAQVVLPGEMWTYHNIYDVTPIYIRTKSTIFDTDEIVDDHNPDTTLEPNGVYLEGC